MSTTINAGKLVAEHGTSDDRRILFASIALGSASYAFFSSLPILLSAIISRSGFTPAATGWLGSAELFGMLFGSIASAVALRFFTYRAISGLTIALLFAATVGSSYPLPIYTACVVRFLSGMSCGVGYVVAVSILNLTRNRVRNVGLLNGVITLAGALELLGFPLLIEAFGLSAALTVIGVEVGVATLLLVWIPVAKHTPGVDRSERSAPGGARHLLVIGIVALTATAINQAGPAASWSFCEQLGDSAGVTTGQMSVVLCVSSLLAAFASISAWRLSVRFGEQLPLMMLVLLQVIIAMSWTFETGGPIGFAIRLILSGTAWAVAGIFQQTSVVAYDRSGNLYVLVPFAQGVGQAIGPLSASLFLDSGYDAQGMLAAFAVPFGISLLLFTWIYFRLLKINPGLIRPVD